MEICGINGIRERGKESWCIPLYITIELLINKNNWSIGRNADVKSKLCDIYIILSKVSYVDFLKWKTNEENSSSEWALQTRT